MQSASPKSSIGHANGFWHEVVAAGHRAALLRMIETLALGNPILDNPRPSRHGTKVGFTSLRHGPFGHA
jgi:hypothetical protein